MRKMNLQVFAEPALPSNPVVPEMNYKTEVFINTAPEGPSATWASMKSFMKNMSQSFNEVLDQATYYGDEGWGHTNVIGGQFTLTVTADIAEGDAACDYIMSDEVRFGFGASRQTHLKLVKGTKVIIWPVTLANITPAYGDAGAVNALTVTIHGNGKPVLGTSTS